MEHAKGIHHITVLAGDPQQNLDFYVHVLGLRLVKRSVNQDDPGTYHLFYGNQSATPGSSLTFFPWPEAVKGEPGTGEAHTVCFSVASNSKDYWSRRLEEQVITFENDTDLFGNAAFRFSDPDGLNLMLVFDQTETKSGSSVKGTVPSEHAIQGFWGVMFSLEDRQPTATLLKELLGFQQVQKTENRTLYQTDAAIGSSVVIETNKQRRGRSGRGIIHHVAFRARDEEELSALRRRVQEWGLMPTQIIDRHWFKSVYFHEPGGILFEMATDGPGYAVDEDPAHLGEKLILPPWLESKREIIEQRLPKIEV